MAQLAEDKVLRVPRLQGWRREMETKAIIAKGNNAD